VHTAQLEPQAGRVRLHIFVDRASVEVSGDGGQTWITDQIFLCAGSGNVELYADGGPVQINALTIYRLNPAAFWLPVETSH
jgi:fructan beta-fructosidase